LRARNPGWHGINVIAGQPALRKRFRRAFVILAMTELKRR
jgi:hypothetical protein